MSRLRLCEALAVRVAYLPLYAYGVPKIRSAAWGVATIGIILILIALI